jgi:hypothetical protein
MSYSRVRPNDPAIRPGKIWYRIVVLMTIENIYGDGFLARDPRYGASMRRSRASGSKKPLVRAVA